MNTAEQSTARDLKELVARAAPAVVARHDLAHAVLTQCRADVRPWRRRALLMISAAIVTTAVAAAGFTDRGDYRNWTQPSGAMAPTVAVGQTVVVAKKARPERGDVVLLTVHHGDDTWETLGRVVGLEGDVVACPADPDGTCDSVIVSGRPLDEPWLHAPTRPFGPVTVPRGHLFFLGDARDQANDSRYVGAQPIDAVLGVVVARIGDDGRREKVPGGPDHELPAGGTVVDPADPVPSTKAVPVDNPS